MNKKTIVVFGGAGYVGSVLVPKLLNENYKVKVFDIFWYGKEVFSSHIGNKNLELHEGDIRNSEAVLNVLQGADDVIHLACISNDPSFDLNPELGKSINLDSFPPLVKNARKQGVKRFIYASSSSVYGVKNEPNVTENLALEPLTDYSRFKSLCEGILMEEASPDFQCTVLRPATVCGASPRQRFDLSVNILTNHAINLNKITVFGGSQYRPNLHIQDMARAYIHVLNQDSKIASKVYNVGGENLSLDQIAQNVRVALNEEIIIQHQSTNDLRSYRVDSNKIALELGFKPEHSIVDAVLDLKKSFEKNEFFNSLENPNYFNIKKMKELSLA